VENGLGSKSFPLGRCPALARRKGLFGFKQQETVDVFYTGSLDKLEMTEHKGPRWRNRSSPLPGEGSSAQLMEGGD
jgi:hypothetical protein